MAQSDKFIHRSELEGMNKGQLYKLAGYLQIPVTTKMRKDEIIELIFEKHGYIPEEDILAGLPEMSVRVKRIYLSSKEKTDV
jgi:Rho termination factor, N-terminal domain